MWRYLQTIMKNKHETIISFLSMVVNFPFQKNTTNVCILISNRPLAAIHYNTKETRSLESLWIPLRVGVLPKKHSWNQYFLVKWKVNVISLDMFFYKYRLANLVVTKCQKSKVYCRSMFIYKILKYKILKYFIVIKSFNLESFISCQRPLFSLFKWLIEP